MADIEPPSFSLGIDFDFEPSQPQNPPHLPTQNDEPEDYTKWRVSDSEPDSPRDSARFRRLRRCPARISTPVHDSPPLSAPTFVDDDIEDFSSEENVRTDHLAISQRHSIGSSSKFPLSGTGILKRADESTLQNKKRKQDASCPSSSIASNKGKSILSDLTSSPLRSFRLLDSDFDDQTPGINIRGVAGKIDSSKTNNQEEYHHGLNKFGCEEKINKEATISEKQDLWEDFYVENNSSVPTPVFDEMFEEYFQGGKQGKTFPGSLDFCSSDIGSSMNNANNLMQSKASISSILPCHRYFFHDDLRIQRLVRSRLPFFCPLSSSGDTGNKTCDASSIDYMSQFGNGDGAMQKPSRKSNVEKNSRSRKKNNKSSLEDNSQSAGPWINPKQTGSSPKDAGKRRVRANGQSPGQWLTGENGKKVYVTKTGQELSGRHAYIRFKKDNGGFRKPKKKSAPKKK